MRGKCITKSLWSTLSLLVLAKTISVATSQEYVPRRIFVGAGCPRDDLRNPYNETELQDIVSAADCKTECSDVDYAEEGSLRLRGFSHNVATTACYCWSGGSSPIASVDKTQTMCGNTYMGSDLHTPPLESPGNNTIGSPLGNSEELIASPEISSTLEAEGTNSDTSNDDLFGGQDPTERVVSGPTIRADDGQDKNAYISKAADEGLSGTYIMLAGMGALCALAAVVRLTMIARDRLCR